MTDNTQSDVVEALPKAFRDQACAISKTGSTVTIECDDADYANDLLDWFASISTKGSDAVLEERERCARIAEALPTDWRDGTQPGPLSAYRHASREIAAAIRKGDNA